MKIREKYSDINYTFKKKFAPLSVDPTEYADVLFGVGSATSAGPCLPAGSIHPSPETLEKDCGGYTRNQPIIGFGQAFISGAGGVKCYGNYLLSPMLSKVEPNHARRASYAVEGEESSRCYEYRVKLENGILTSFTPAHNSAIYKIDYPVGETPVLMIDVAHKLDIDACMRSGSVTVDSANRRIYGGGLYFGNWNRHDWNMYFAMELDAAPVRYGIMSGDGECEYIDGDIVTCEAVAEKRFGVFCEFSAKEQLSLKVKIAISFVSAERAIEHLEREIPDFDYDRVRDQAREEWRDVLGVIELKSNDAKLLRRFYTAMYHMNVQPRDRVADNGKWDDFHTVWDTWKTVFPMYSLLYPKKMGRIVESFIDRARENERLGNGIVVADEFSTAHETLAGQGGNDVDNAIADAYIKGVPLERYDWEDAYKVLLASAEHMRSKEYVEGGFATNNRTTVTGLPYTIRFKSAAATLGFAFNDRAVAAVARELGTDEEYQKYLARSGNWRNVWNTELESEGFYGFPQSPNLDGTFPEGFDAHKGYNVDFYEATGWDASYINYNDASGLVDIMGGAKTFTDRLLFACEHSVNYYNDDEGAEGYLNFTNEPSFHIPWLFCIDEIRRPDLAAKVIDTILERFSLEHDYPGDEDNGGMSSYYVFLMCGIFPYSTTEKYYLHGTRVDEIVFRLGNGNLFKITGDNVKDGNIYVKSATFNGEPLNDCSLTHEQIIRGGHLHFVMDSEPSDWARK